MSELNHIPSTSQDSESSDNTKDPSVSEVTCTINNTIASKVEDEATDRKSDVSVPTSKIARPTGLKLPTPSATGSTSGSRIARLCNNVPKPSVPASILPTPSKFLCFC